MLLQNRYPLDRIFNHIWKQVLGVTVYAAIISFAHEEYKMEYLEIPPTIPSILGTALALFLGFRTNSAYDRWWEARKIWGSIVNDTRSFTRQLLTFIKTNSSTPGINAHDYIRKLSGRSIGWCYSLTRTLRNQDPFTELSEYIDEEDLAFLKSHENVPNGILQLQGEAIKKGKEADMISEFGMIRIDATLTSLCDSMGMCERIKNTVFPTQYRLFIHLLIFFFVFLLPFGLVDSMGYLSIIISTVITFLFLMIETVEMMLQDPFECKPNDTPMLSLSRTIEINIKQQLRESDIPEQIKPVNGILY